MAVKNSKKKTSPKKKTTPKKKPTVTKVPTGASTQKWQQRFAECKEFQAEHGHCKIPTAYKENKSLGVWVQEMRRNFKRQKTGKEPRCPLSNEEITKLDEIGFHWGFTPDPFKEKELDESWEANFAKLKAFQEEHGHFDVPLESDTKELGIWVRVQRHQEKLRKDKKSSPMTSARFKKLSEIGIDWNGLRELD